MFRKIDIIIIGASIAGLMHARVLQSLGLNILILEQKESLESDSGLSLGPYAQKLLRTYVYPDQLDDLAIQNKQCVHFYSNGEVKSDQPLPRGTTSVRTSRWNTVYQLLLKGLEANTLGNGQVTLKTSRQVTGIRKERGKIKVMYRSENRMEGEDEADLVIAADGAHSVVRRELLPDLEAKYIGYLAWRGDIPAKDCPPHLQCVLEGKLGFLSIPESSSYIIWYAKPSAEKSRHSTSSRRVEWCWYHSCKDPSEYLKDRNGRPHRQTVTPDLIDRDAWKRQLACAGHELPAWCLSLLHNCSAPLLSILSSFNGTRGVFWDDKVVLVGEALWKTPPYLGASCDMAAQQALLLKEMLFKEKGLHIWETEALKYARERATISNAVGQTYMKVDPSA